MSRVTLVLGLAALMARASPGHAQDLSPVPVRLHSGSVSLNGTSNLRAFACQSSKVDAQITIDRDTVSVAAHAQPFQVHVAVQVALTSLDCGVAGIGRDLVHTLHGDVDPLIIYTLDSYDIVAGSAATDSVRANTISTLTVAGVEKSVSMLVSGHRLADGRIEASGSLLVKMSDFGVAPPRLFFGTLRVRDAITIHFDLTTEAVKAH